MLDLNLRFAYVLLILVQFTHSLQNGPKANVSLCTARKSRSGLCYQLTKREFFGRLSIHSATFMSVFYLKPESVSATTGSIKTTQFATKGQAISKTTNDPKQAFSNILKAKDELEYAQTLLMKAIKSEDDNLVDDLKAYLSDRAINMNNFEGNALVLLQSKLISDETRKEIGTIRRYGVGADVQIMYGGLIAELDASDYPDLGEVNKYLTRTLDSLSEVITLCKSDGAF